MNKRDELFNTIKSDLKKFFSFGNEEKTNESKFSDLVLSDGTKITVPGTDLEVGAEVFKIDEMGNQTPLDPGEYVLNDGRTFETDGKVVTEIMGPDSTQEETPVSDANTTTEQDASKVKMDDGMANTPSEESDLASRVTDLENKLDELANLMKQLMDGTTQANEQMMSKLQAFSDEPGALPIRTMKRGYEEYTKKTPNQIALKELREELESKRNSNKFI